jgi:AcrR family transcriptional regulator
MANDSDPPQARRTGGRSARVRAAALTATVDVLFESGFDTLSIREIAKRAGVHVSSIYRRWGTKAELVSDALASRMGLEVPTPDTGSLREDLLTLLRAAAAFISTPLGENLVRMALRRDLPDSDTVRDRFWTDRFTRGSVILDRALETLVGPLYLRLLLTREPLNETIIENVVDLMLTGIAAEHPWSAAHAPSPGPCGPQALGAILSQRSILAPADDATEAFPRGDSGMD